MATHAGMQEVNSTAERGRLDRYFYPGAAGAILLAMLMGFGRSYYLRAFADSPPLSTFTHVHALVFTAWVLLFFIQTSLVAAGRADLHRRLGVAAGVLAGGMVVLGFQTAIYGARNGHNPGGPYRDSRAFLVVGLTDILLFFAFVAAALYCRRRREAHKRLMLLATIGGFMLPAITRMPVVAGRFLPMFGLLSLFVLAGPAYDLATRRRVHPIYFWGGLLILASFPLRRMIGNSDPWHRFAAWLIG